MSDRVRDVDRSPLSELDVPPCNGWEVSVSQEKRGPIYTAFNPAIPEEFKLSNRHFEVIDYYVSYKFLGLIIKKIKENSGRKVVVLDLGGGVNSEAVRGILRHPFLKGKVKVINVDLFARNIPREELEAEGIDSNDIVIINEDFATGTGVPDDSVDAVISYQVLDYVVSVNFSLVLDNVARVLAPGGEALIDESQRTNRMATFEPFLVFPHGFPGGFLQEISNRRCVTISSTYRETRLDGITSIIGAGRGMLHMAKSYPQRKYNFPQLDFSLAWPEVVDAVKDYGVPLPGPIED